MNKLSKEKKQQLILVVGGTLGAIVAIYFLMISAQLAEATKRKKETEETSQKVEAAEKLVKKSEEVEKDMTKRAKQLELIESQMASGDLAVWIPNTIKQIRVRHPAVTIAKVGEGENTQVGVLPVFPYNAIKFVVRGSGYYHDLGKFFTDFENSLPYFRIQNVDLDPGDASLSGDVEKLAFRADFVVLLKPEPVATPSPKPK